MKTIMKNLTELSYLKINKSTELKNLDLEGYQTEIDVQMKKLLKTYHSYSQGRSPEAMSRINTFSESFKSSIVQTVPYNQSLVSGGFKNQNRAGHTSRTPRIPGVSSIVVTSAQPSIGDDGSGSDAFVRANSG